MSDPFLGELRLFPYYFAPRGWAFCQGQIIAISQNEALFSLLGTTYGGNGVQTFALPDLRGRVPLSSNEGAGLSNYVLGEIGGQEQVTLLLSEMPAHNHPVHGSSTATSKNPSGAKPGYTGSGSSYGTASDLTMAPDMVGVTGSNLAHENRPPYLVLNWCIALEGIFPSRN